MAARLRRAVHRSEGQNGRAGAGGSTQLIVNMAYANELPKPPVPKLLQALPPVERLCRYAPSSLELEHRPCAPPETVRLEEVAARAEMARKRKRLEEPTEAFHRQAFGLQLPQLITNDVFTERQRFTTGLEAAEKKIFREPPGFSDTQTLAERIEATFEAAQKPPVHPSNPAMKARRVLPIVPDAVLWVNKYRQIVFDEPPKQVAANDLLFRTTPTPRLTCFGFFAPAEDGEAGAYSLVQNYVWENRGGFTRATDCGEGEAMLLSFPDPKDEAGEVRFVSVPTYMQLKKLKAHTLEIPVETRTLNVKHRDPSAQEVAEERML